MKKIAFISFGCKVNSAEIDSMIAKLASSTQAQYCEDAAEADIIVVNTCAVTEKAQKDGERYLRSLKKSKPTCLIVATGCIAELYKSNPTKLGADMLIPNGNKAELMRLLLPELSSTPHSVKPIPTKTRAFLKIQDGCNAFCSYCIIPSLRGAPTSIGEDEAVAEFQRLLTEGYKEIVLTGIHIGLYESGLDKLLERLIALDGAFRIRLSSLYIGEITDTLIQIVLKANGKIAPHFHISLQSGSSEILRRMGRKYSAQEAEALISKLRGQIQYVTIGADIITGFPSETEALFQETMSFLERNPLDFLHIFPYSIRKGTAAAEYCDQLPQAIKQDRAKILRNMGEAMALASAQKIIGQTVTVLTEKGNKGHSAGYHMIQLPEGTPTNMFIDMQVGVNSDGKLQGVIATLPPLSL